MKPDALDPPQGREAEGVLQPADLPLHRGTAAAEGWPALFCTCDACLQARARGGKEVRSRAAYMLGDRVRVDFGPDSYLHQQKYGLAYEKLEHLLVTHSHDDHWFPKDLAYRRAGFYT